MVNRASGIPNEEHFPVWRQPARMKDLIPIATAC